MTSRTEKDQLQDNALYGPLEIQAELRFNPDQNTQTFGRPTYAECPVSGHVEKPLQFCLTRSRHPSTLAKCTPGMTPAETSMNWNSQGRGSIVAGYASGLPETEGVWVDQRRRLEMLDLCPTTARRTSWSSRNLPLQRISPRARSPIPGGWMSPRLGSRQYISPGVRRPRGGSM